MAIFYWELAVFSIRSYKKIKISREIEKNEFSHLQYNENYPSINNDTKITKATDYKKLERLTIWIRSLGKSNDLNLLAKLFRTDKAGGHSYTPHYMYHFRNMRYAKIKLLEIGVGGYHHSELGGNSLRMWKKFFPYGNVFGIDIYDKSSLEEDRIRIFKGNQIDQDFLDQVVYETGELDIIIDDGSHINEHVIETFKILFPKLRDGGIYVIEDTQTSYWTEYGGDSNDLNKPNTTMNFFKSLTDTMNHQEFILPDYQQTYYDQKIVSMHFYHNLIFIYKGDNSEKSNLVRNHQKI